MPKLSHCDRCRFYAHDYHLICVPHPTGPDGESCPDFTPYPDAQNRRFEDFLGLQWEIGEGMEDSETPIDNPFDLDPDEEQWELEGARFVNGALVIERDNDSGASPWEHRSFYNGEEITQPRQRWTREEQLEMLDWHPLFTGRCPQCGAAMEQDYRALVHWDCPACGWLDDTV